MPLVTSTRDSSFEPPQADRPVSDLRRDDERELVERAKQDPRQFGALYDRHFQQIYRFVYSRVREQTAAEDVTSEVFMKALKAVPRYQDTGRPFAAWLYQIAANAIADRYRTLRTAQPLDDFHDLSVAGPALEELAAHRDEIRRIWALVEGLPSQQRTALVLKFQEDMKIDDIAAAMGKSAGAVKLLIHRGVSRLREDAGALRPVE
ncbi:sigma-70 family RNA polymerase sigma factor [bacterium]|nr:MAG: sigma-70 family RNA polymerase sigma factor [bacterium]